MGGAISKKSIKHTTPISHYLKNPTEQENLNALKEFAMIQLLEPLKKKNDSKNIFEFFNSDTDPQKKRSNSEARYMKFAPFEVGQDETMRKICSPHRLPKINPTKKTTNKLNLKRRADSDGKGSTSPSDSLFITEKKTVLEDRKENFKIFNVNQSPIQINVSKNKRKLIIAPRKLSIENIQKDNSYSDKESFKSIQIGANSIALDYSNSNSQVSSSSLIFNEIKQIRTDQQMKKSINSKSPSPKKNNFIIKEKISISQNINNDQLIHSPKKGLPPKTNIIPIQKTQYKLEEDKLSNKNTSKGEFLTIKSDIEENKYYHDLTKESYHRSFAKQHEKEKIKLEKNEDDMKIENPLIVYKKKNLIIRNNRQKNMNKKEK